MILDEDQRLLQASAKDFVATRSSLKRVRALAADPAGFSRDLWGEMARLGWLGLSFPEEHGGAGLPWRYLMVVLEELGAGLVPEPMLSTVLLGGTAILLGGDDAQKRRHLPRIAAGEELIALAYQEAGSRYALDGIEARADGGTVSGEKIQVLGGSASTVSTGATPPSSASTARRPRLSAASTCLRASSTSPPSASRRRCSARWKPRSP